MKRTITILALVLFSTNAFAFEQAMHLYLAHEAFKHLRLGDEFYRAPVANELEAAYAILQAYGKECDGARKDECNEIKAHAAKLQKQLATPEPSPAKGVKVFFPFVGKAPPYTAAKDGIAVAAPFAEALKALGTQEFFNFFAAGVLGADSFPDFFAGGMAAHVDLSNLPLSIKNMPGLPEVLKDILKDVKASELKLWKSWQWGELVFKAREDKALFTRLASEWPEGRPYWGKKYVKADLAKRFQHEATAFAYGYWVHMAQDAVAHEMVSSFSTGAIWFMDIATDKQIPFQRHSAIEGYLLEKMRPFMWRIGATIRDLKIPVPFVREVLMKGQAVVQAPFAVHLLTLNKLGDLFGYLFGECKSPGFTKQQCGGKEPPAVYQFLNCVSKDEKCLMSGLCFFAKTILANQVDKVRDAMDGWLLLSLAITRQYAGDTFHPRLQSPGVLSRYTPLLKEYGFTDAAAAGYKPVTDQVQDYPADATRIFAEQFLIPAVLPVRITYSKNHEPQDLKLDPAFEKQIDIDCAFMGFTNLVAVCEFAKQAVIATFLRLFEKVKVLVDQVEGVFANALARGNFERGQRNPSQVSASAAKFSAKPASGSVLKLALGAAKPPPKEEKPPYVATPDVKVNRMYPCSPGKPCEAAIHPEGPVAETPIAREIKRRLERFVGMERTKEVLASDWKSCSGAKDEKGLTGEARGKCFSDRVFRAILTGKLTDSDAPPHASPFVRRAITMTLLAIISGGSIPELVKGQPGDFPERAACEKAAMTTNDGKKRDHLWIDVQASLVCVNRVKPPKLENRHFDELAEGKFALYGKACEPLYKAILPEIADSDGDGLNDIYDTCPDQKCVDGWKKDPTGDHVGADCAGKTGTKLNYCTAN